MARNQNVTQFRVNSQAAFRDTQNIEEIALFDADGNVIDLSSLGEVAAHVAPVATAAATDLASAEALANQNKATINAVIASLIASGLMASS